MNNNIYTGPTVQSDGLAVSTPTTPHRNIESAQYYVVKEGVAGGEISPRFTSPDQAQQFYSRIINEGHSYHGLRIAVVDRFGNELLLGG